jgi:phenylpropionate dioxygenase-like ring-hydroxylating dioxygenase large terminal subunit
MTELLSEIPGRPQPSMQELLAEDERVPEALRKEYNDFVGGKEDPTVEDYLSRDVYLREVDRIWKRTWQFACRTEEIKNVGDHVLYEIADVSLIIMRSSPTEIKAFYNACLHRGRQLRECGGNVPALRCPFHGFAWGTDGRLKGIPARWDFPDIHDEEWSLPEAKVGQWGGFVFVNLDPEARPLEEYIVDLPEHFASWDHGGRYKAVHVGKVLKANWKIALEAFLENLHGITTHPQVLPYLYDQGVQYDARTDRPHWNRMIGALGIPSPYLAKANLTEQQILDSMRIILGPEPIELPAGVTARRHAANLLRERTAALFGRDFSDVSDAEILDLIVYFVFPNFDLFGGFGFAGTIHRFRPWQNDHEQVLWELMLLLPVPPGAEAPPPAPMRMLGENETFSDVAEIGDLGPFFDQDCSNIEWVQKGLHTTRRSTVKLSNYQESLIRHFYKTRARYLAGEDL